MEPQDTWICGIDVGQKNLGIAFLDRFQYIIKEADNVDMTVDGSKRIELTSAYFGRYVSKWMKFFKPQFERCTKVGIEHQPGFAKPTMHIVQAHLESTIRHLYPHIKEVRLVDPKKVRQYFGTNGGAYKERKGKSVEAFCFAKVDRDRFKRTFKKQKWDADKRKWRTQTKCDDAMEACELALYLAHAYNDEPNEPNSVTTSAPAVIRIREVPMRRPADPPSPKPKKKKRPKEPEGRVIKRLMMDDSQLEPQND